MKIAIIGLGYVGLPLAVEFGKKFDTRGFDISASRIAELNQGKDSTFEVEDSEFRLSNKLSFTSQVDQLKGYDYYIVTVPTPIDSAKKPDLKPLIAASKTVGLVIGEGATVIYESTVYPGASEEVVTIKPDSAFSH